MKISMSFATTLFPIFLVCCFSSLATTTSIGPGFSYGSYIGGGQHCRGSERDALLKLKHDLIDPSNRLASWAAAPNDHSDCCRWLGVVCDNVTGHVTHLLLRSLSEEEYDDAFPDATDDDYATSYLLGGKINPSLLNLTHLMHLDLSNNDFGGIPIPKFIGSLGNLKYLNLSAAGFGGMIPHQLGNLSNLHYLNLRNDGYNDYESYVENLDWVSGLCSLEFLDLSYVNLSKAFDWLEVIKKALPSLVELHLSSSQLPHVSPHVNLNFSSLSILDLSSNDYALKFPSWASHLKNLVSLNLASCDLQGPIPNDLQNLTSLRELDLSWNHFNSSIPNWLYGFSHLELLYLTGNNLQGEVSSAIGNMTSLIILDFSDNLKLEFNGGIPASLKNLCNLKFLYLPFLKLNQHIAEVFEILSDKLESLYLSNCQLFGGLTCNHVRQFKNLVSLHLGDNQLNGSIPHCLGDLVSLRSLKLYNNSFSGTLPMSFYALTKLEDVDISYNLMVGDVFEFHFANLTKLQYFIAGGNQLTLRASPIHWIPPLQLGSLDLRSWNIGPQFPTWLRSLKYLSFLDLSNSNISSTIPAWFWNFSSQLISLNLSHNHIHGAIPNNLELDFSNSYIYVVIDLSSNNFEGPLPSIILPNVYSLDLSNNSFSGSIFNLLCSTKMSGIMRFLNLGENLLSGEIPDCWMSLQYLESIKLSNNRFSGDIPQSLGTLSSLKSLHLRNNSLSGALPMSLQSCTKLVTLDIGENEVRGNIPTWMGERLSSLVVLNMRANKFHGHIPKELCKLAALQILDLAHNYLSGSIPTCVNNLNAMANTTNDVVGYIDLTTNTTSIIFENQVLMMKGTIVEYSTILKLMRSIDLSNNALCGEIPTEITRLEGLLSLNLSQNVLTGKIPKSIGAMRYMESTDFSLNQLSGEIPPRMSSLTFLNHLNLSHNKLVGKIPLGTQLQSFDPSCYMGNQLYGPPLSKSFSGDGANQDVKNRRDEDGNGVKVNGFFMSMTLGFIVGFWSTVGSLLFNRRWRYVYFRFLNMLWDKF